MLRWLVVVLVVSSGCESVPAPATQEELETFCRERNVATCEQRQRCGLLRPSFDCSQQAASAECVSGLNDSLSREGAYFNREAAQRCVDESRDKVCTSILGGLTGLSHACAQLIIGVAREGERCGACAKGLYCGVAIDAACGVCVRIGSSTLPPDPGPAAVGASCDPQRAVAGGCVWQSSCERTADDGGVCTLRAEAGASCESARCSPFAMCLAAVCTPLREPGESCRSSSECHQDLFCDDGVCAARKPLGVACEQGDACETRLCLDGVCRRGAVAGGACGFDVGHFCEADLGCADGVCVPLPQVGEPCTGLFCAKGARCVMGTCVDSLAVCR